MSRKKKPEVGPVAEPVKSGRLLRAEHKLKIAEIWLATATATATRCRAAADAISWDTPLLESGLTRKAELEAEKALRAATLAVKRAKHSAFKAGCKA